MASGYILIVAILVLGGVIAASGDRIGTRVGKARLTLFNLRPRQTATLVTIVTGSLIGVSTLGILLAADKRLRTGVFDLKRIENKLSRTRKDLAQVVEQKKQVENELVKAQSSQTDAQKLLDEINNSKEAAIAKQALTAAQLKNTQSQLKIVSQQKVALGNEIKQLQAARQELTRQRNQVKEQVTQLNSQVTQLNSQVTQLKAQITQRDREIAKRDLTIAQRNRAIAQRFELEKQLKKGIAERERSLTALEKQLQERENRLALLEREVGTLEAYYQVLRQGNVALFRNQVLANGVLRVVEPSAARMAIDQLLSQANRTAIQATRPGSNNNKERVLQITPAQVDQLLNQINDGRDYVVRILSAGNYVVGEKQVQVFADVALNQVVFSAGDIVAATSAEPSMMSQEEIRKRLDQLLAASQFRARRSGILGEPILQVGDGRITTLIRFLEQVKEYNQPVDLKAVVTEDTYTAGPLKIKLVAVKDGQVVFST